MATSLRSLQRMAPATTLEGSPTAPNMATVPAPKVGVAVPENMYVIVEAANAPATGNNINPRVSAAREQVRRDCYSLFVPSPLRVWVRIRPRKTRSADISSNDPQAAITHVDIAGTPAATTSG